jgi:hypothetical protein
MVLHITDHRNEHHAMASYHDVIHMIFLYLLVSSPFTSCGGE